MSTGVTDWVNLEAIGPLYPFVGTEWLLTIICLVFWVWVHIRSIKDENRDLDEQAEYYRRTGAHKAVLRQVKPRLPDDA